MILYHGTNLDIRAIDLALSRPYKDFGRGFYTTDILSQAKNMAVRVAKIYGSSPIVNIYSIADDFMTLPNLNIKDFGADPSEEWASFVMNNRNKRFINYENKDCNLDCKFDIVHGSVVNDDMDILFRQYQEKLISLEMLIKGLTYRKAISQYSFHTEKVVGLLKKEGILQ